MAKQKKGESRVIGFKTTPIIRRQSQTNGIYLSSKTFNVNLQTKKLSKDVD